VFSYLVAFAYWIGIAVGALILLASFHASNARWMVVLRRGLEITAVSVGVFVLLFIPVALGLKQLFPWASPAELPEKVLHHLEHKRAYLNAGAFVLRAVLYFVVWLFVGERLFGFSVQQDATGDVALTQRQRALGAGSLPFLALAITFASFDWLMSLTPEWSSTIFGLYYFSGSFTAAIAVWTLASLWARGKDLYGDLVTPDHLHNLGKLLLAFTCFWAYMAFSQYMLIWAANLPEESVWYLVRTRHGWKPLAIFLVLGEFLVPFFLLLSQGWKLSRRFMTGISLWLLFAHWVDVYWLVMPALHPEGPKWHWTNLTAFVGVGGLAFAYALFRAQGRYTLAVRDPYLADSMRYTQP
jgi:hypothetical protein